jgi:hypothetical protein
MTNTSKLGDAADAGGTGGADGGCFLYYPQRSAGSNIQWFVQTSDGLGGSGTTCVGAGAGTTQGIVPTKYRPKT